MYLSFQERLHRTPLLGKNFGKSSPAFGTVRFGKDQSPIKIERVP